jgi:hypothetical protein
VPFAFSSVPVSARCGSPVDESVAFANVAVPGCCGVAPPQAFPPKALPVSCCSIAMICASIPFVLAEPAVAEPLDAALPHQGAR